MATTIDNLDGEEKRSAWGLLAVGIFLLPIVFVWFLLRKGHSTFARVVGFTWFLVWCVGFVNTINTSADLDQARAETDMMVDQLDLESDSNAAAGGADGAAANAKPASAWTYDETKDEMRGTTTKYATAEAISDLRLAWPYGTSRPTLSVRKGAKYGLDIYVRADAQFLCRSYDDSHVNVKFDDGPIRRYDCTDSSSGSRDVVFIRNESNFLAKLKKAKKVTIEAEIYEAGYQQMTFDVAGLDW